MLEAWLSLTKQIQIAAAAHLPGVQRSSSTAAAVAQAAAAVLSPASGAVVCPALPGLLLLQQHPDYLYLLLLLLS